MKLKKFKFKKVKSTNNTAIRIVKETKQVPKFAGITLKPTIKRVIRPKS